MTIDGKELLEIRPDFADRPRMNATRFSRMSQQGQARRIGFFPGKKAVHTLNHRYVLRGANVDAFEAFFNARRGRHESFLVPSYVAELGCGTTNVTGSPAAGTDLYIDWCDYETLYGPVEGFLGQYIFILWPDGTFFATEVEAVAASVADVHDRLTLADALPKDVTTDDGQVIGFCYDVRFMSDEIELEYVGLDCAMAEIAFIEDVDSEPEADET